MSASGRAQAFSQGLPQLFPGPTHSIEWGRGVSGGAGPDTHDLGGAASQTDGALGRTQGAHPSSRFASWRAACTGAAGVLGLPLARPSQRHSGDVPFRPFPPAPLPRRPDPSAMPKQSAAKQRRAPQPQAAEPDSTSGLDAGVGGLQGEGSYPHVGPDGDDGAESDEAPHSQPGAWGIQGDVSSGEEPGGGVLAVCKPSGRRSVGQAAGGRATSQRCIICGDSSADVPWWSMGPVEMGDGTFQAGAKGSWCWLCGTTAEAWPLMTAEALVERRRATPPFRTEFAAARHRAQRNQKQPGAAADMSVVTRKSTGIRVAREVAFIELADAVAFFKQDMSKMSGLQVVRLPPPSAVSLRALWWTCATFRPVWRIPVSRSSPRRLLRSPTPCLLRGGGGLLAGRARQGHLAVFGEPRSGCQAAASAAGGDGGPHRLRDPRGEGLQDAGCTY